MSVMISYVVVQARVKYCIASIGLMPLALFNTEDYNLIPVTKPIKCQLENQTTLFVLSFDFYRNKNSESLNQHLDGNL